MTNMNPMIILPQTVYILRDKENQGIITNREEYSVYYENIIYPYSCEYDIKIDCDYGKNLGTLWRIDDFKSCPRRFPLSISVYLYGSLLAKKQIYVEITERSNKELSLMCIGDSMTQTEEYEMQAVIKSEHIRTLGTRRIKLVSHEGRGGLRLYDYLFGYENKGWFTSPFLFPEGVEAKKYYGDVSFWEGVKNSPNHYTSIGFEFEEIKNGMYCLKEGKLCVFENGSYTVKDNNPKFSFDFAKYLERFNIDTPDVVSFLFGANDLQTVAYEDAFDEIEKMLSYQQEILENVRKCGAKVIINLPICGADQYSWGTKLGCVGTVKQYEHNIKHYAKALLEKYDGREDEGIYICPMLAVCDPKAGFDTAFSPANQYTILQEFHQTNWVHPNVSGYKQMGDALAGVLCNVKCDLDI